MSHSGTTVAGGLSSVWNLIGAALDTPSTGADSRDSRPAMCQQTP